MEGLYPLPLRVRRERYAANRHAWAVGGVRGLACAARYASRRTVSHRILKNMGVGYPAPYKVLPPSHQSWFSPEKTNFDGNLVRLCTLALSACGGVVNAPVENFSRRGEKIHFAPARVSWGGWRALGVRNHSRRVHLFVGS